MDKLDRNKFIMQRVHDHYNEACKLGFEVVGVWLQGSQNYKLDLYTTEYTSDVDTKCIVLPTLSDIVMGKVPYSHTHVRKNNEHIDIKDIRVMFEMFKKQNNAYIELLFTDYFVINPKYTDLVKLLINKAEDIAHINVNQALRCLAGTSLEKYKALEHPYPTVIDKINKFGYDPKQLHHILRVNDMIKKYVTGVNYKDCLIPNDPKYLIEVKLGKYSLDEARVIANEYDKNTNSIKNNYLTKIDHVNKETLKFLDDLKVSFIKRFLKEELKLDE